VEEQTAHTSSGWYKKFMPALAALGAFVLFLLAIELLVASLKVLGESATETILLATSNPFTAFFIGLLVTAIIQSSSTTTSLTVAMVASGSLSIESAVPIVMGANIGTTITSTLISLGFINKKKEFQRAVAAGTYHDFFNILTAVILFPLEYYYNFLSQLAIVLTSWIYRGNPATAVGKTDAFFSGFDPLVNALVSLVNNGFVLALLAIAMLFGSILLFRKLISEWMKLRSQEFFGTFFFKNPVKSFAWGVGITAAIRSSTVTTSLVVPLVAKKVVKLRNAAPFILGANVGTTITAFIAAILYANNESAIVIATSHFLFNAIGVLLFLPLPLLRKIPLDLADKLGKLTLRYRLAGLVYLLLTFFFIPFSLIYFNRNAVETITVTYQKTIWPDTTRIRYNFVARYNQTTKSGDWISYDKEVTNNPITILPFYIRNNALFYKNEMILFSKQGFCWDGENLHGKYKACIENTVNQFEVANGLTLDSVFVVRFSYYNNPDFTERIWISRYKPLILKQEKTDSIRSVTTLKIVEIKQD